MANFPPSPGAILQNLPGDQKFYLELASDLVFENNKLSMGRLFQM